MPLIDYLCTRNIARTVRKDEDAEAAHVITSQMLPRRDEASLQCDHYYQLSLLFPCFQLSQVRQVWGGTFIYKNVYTFYNAQSGKGSKRASDEVSERIGAWIADQIHDPFATHPLRQCSLFELHPSLKSLIL